jgi:hypothetical protein
MAERPDYMAMKAGWARFVSWPGEMTITGADGTTRSTGERKPVDEHLKAMGLTEAEIAHAMGKPGTSRRRVTGRGRRVRKSARS